MKFLMVVVIILFMLLKVARKATAKNNEWEHPLNYFSIEVPEGWKIKKDPNNNHYLLSNREGRQVKLFYHPRDITDIDYFKAVINIQLISIGLAPNWKEKKITRDKAINILAIRSSNTTAGYLTLGDFVFEVLTDAKGERAEEDLIKILTALSTDAKLEDPTAGHPELIGIQWKLYQANYSAQGNSSLGSSETWTFYPDGILNIYSFTQFSKGSGKDHVSNSDQRQATVSYWILDNNIHLYGTDFYTTMPFNCEEGKIKLDQNFILTSEY